MVSASIATFFVPLIEARLYDTAGEVSTTAIVTVARPVPPGPVAITVSSFEAKVVVGVPEITPVERLSETPDGKVLPPLSA